VVLVPVVPVVDVDVEVVVVPVVVVASVPVVDVDVVPVVEVDVVPVVEVDVVPVVVDDALELLELDDEELLLELDEADDVLLLLLDELALAPDESLDAPSLEPVLPLPLEPSVDAAPELLPALDVASEPLEAEASTTCGHRAGSSDDVRQKPWVQSWFVGHSRSLLHDLQTNVGSDEQPARTPSKRATRARMRTPSHRRGRQGKRFHAPSERSRRRVSAVTRCGTFC